MSGDEQQAAQHLCDLYAERIQLSRDLAVADRPSKQMVDAVFAKGRQLDDACEDFRRRFYPRRYRVAVGVGQVYTASRTGLSVQIIYAP